MEEEKILENITKSITEKLKVPIILTYVCVLVIHNWDILFYLFFESSTASSKIKYVKDNYSELYYERIFDCLIIAVILIILFTILNTAINFCLKWFYRKDKEISSQIESYEQVSFLREQLSKSLEEIKKLKSQVESLNNINESLKSKNLDINVDEISRKDFDSILLYISSQPNKDKLLFSFKEFINAFKKGGEVEREQLYKGATYEHEMKLLVDYFARANFLKIDYRYNNITKNNGYLIDLSKSIKDILLMDI